MDQCISVNYLIANWHTLLPLALLAIEYIMGLIPGNKAKGLSHLLLIMYQNAKAPKPVVYVTPGGAVAPPPPPPPTLPASGGAPQP